MACHHDATTTIRRAPPVLHAPTLPDRAIEQKSENRPRCGEFRLRVPTHTDCKEPRPPSDWIRAISEYCCVRRSRVRLRRTATTISQHGVDRSVKGLLPK